MDSHDDNSLLLSDFFLENSNTTFLVLPLVCVANPYWTTMNLNVNSMTLFLNTEFNFPLENR